MSPLVSHAVLDEIRLANDIVAVIGSYFQIQRSGSAYKALCPFHKEKTPSFMVNPQRQTFHCFGCNAGGDVFRFVMDYEKVDFMTAVKMLARKGNVRLTFEDGSEGDRMSKDILYDIMAGAARLYNKLLAESPGAKEARDYLASRKLEEKTIQEFMIGYAPDRSDTIIQWAGKKYQRAQLEAVGLVVSSTSGGVKSGSAAAYDRFRNRLMFPIHDEQGRVVGFSGRILRDLPQVAKYVNTPETALFHKGRLLYALNKARRAIVDRHEAIVCEGQIDVIRCHLAGFVTAVAAQGTAFTDDHARILKRYADGVLLAFDGDSAGQKAALRASEVFLRSGLAVRIAGLPEGSDPDTIISARDGAAAFKGLLDKAKSVIDFQIDTLTRESKPDTDAAIMRVSNAVLNMIVQTTNAVQRAAMLKSAAERLGIPQHTLGLELTRFEKRVRTFTAAEDQPAAAELPLKEMTLIEHLFSEPKLALLVKKYLPLDLVTNELGRRVIGFCLDAEENGRDVMSILAEKDDPDRKLTALAARASGAPIKIKGENATHEEGVKGIILALRREALQRRRKEIKTRLQAAQLSGSMPEQERKKLEIENGQLEYDLHKLKLWDTALPVLELI